MIRCFIDNQEIDLVYESQIAISLSIASVTQVETGRTGYSKTIRVPMTVRNNSILGNAAEIHSPEMFNQMAHTARIEADGCTVIEGMPMISRCGQDADGSAWYLINILGAGKEWVRLAAERMFKEIDIPFETTLSASTVYQSWSWNKPVRFFPVQRDRFIRQNVSRRDKHMHPVRSGGAAIRQIPLNRRERQYTYLLEVARDLPENTAVLYRDHDSALPLIDLLERNGVPYRAKQTDGTFFSSRIVRDITDIIRFAQSPWDGALFRRIYYKFCAGIPKAVAERAAAHNPTAEPLLLAVADDDVSPYTRRQCRMLQTHLQNLRTEKANRAVYRIVAFMGYGDYLDQCGADKSRAEILEALGAQEPDPLRLLERLDELQTLLRQPKSEARGLILSTVHSSKGLEYDRVFLLDVIDGVFPKEGEDVDRDEERRLFYVAMTRARNELAVFTFPPEKTSSAFSQFLFRPKRRIPRKSNKKTAADSFLPGTPVQHSAYGAGRILAREGDRVRIRFSSGSERVFSLAAAVPNGLLSLRQESGGNTAKAD